MGGDHIQNYKVQVIIKFQSTPPMWVVTKYDRNRDKWLIFQSTPPMWVVTHYKIPPLMIHGFQSTPPMWVVTLVIIDWDNNIKISIHTTHVGGDYIVCLSI